MSEHSDHQHVTPLSTYIKVYVGLVILTLITVAASRINMGEANTLIAMVIATVKAGLVLAFFMHLKAEGKLNRVTIGSALVFVIIFYSLTASDIFTRKNYTEIALPAKIEAAKAKKSAEEGGSKTEAPAAPTATPTEGK